VRRLRLISDSLAGSDVGHHGGRGHGGRRDRPLSLRVSEVRISFVDEANASVIVVVEQLVRRDVVQMMRAVGGVGADRRPQFAIGSLIVILGGDSLAVLVEFARLVVLDLDVVRLHVTRQSHRVSRHRENTVTFPRRPR
jgi:hypothetical protein